MPWVTVRRAANLSAALLAKKNAPTSTQSSLTAFKASRGLVCRCVSARFAASSGVWYWLCSNALSACWFGPHGAVGIQGSPNIGTTNDAQFHKYNCSTRADSWAEAPGHGPGPARPAGAGDDALPRWGAAWRSKTAWPARPKTPSVQRREARTSLTSGGAPCLSPRTRRWGWGPWRRRDANSRTTSMALSAPVGRVPGRREAVPSAGAVPANMQSGREPWC